ncbi:peptide ABC transporter [Anopheles sinensis]|uniref:Peptide ABC transporter n=1 Tax=Anopheles sinensis TaxID=74873 RepID=A0A084W818_ANOSI|nr:peptide ABC transporter [Anopheles sinensis]
MARCWPGKDIARNVRCVSPRFQHRLGLHRTTFSTPTPTTVPDSQPVIPCLLRSVLSLARFSWRLLLAGRRSDGLGGFGYHPCDEEGRIPQSGGDCM